MRRRLTGWIFDAYPEADGIRLWVITPEGRAETFRDAWRPNFCVEETHAPGALAVAKTARIPYTTARREKWDIYSCQSKNVLEVTVPTGVYESLVKKITRLEIPLYNADIHLVQFYHYTRGHFPL